MWGRGGPVGGGGPWCGPPGNGFRHGHGGPHSGSGGNGGHCNGGGNGHNKLAARFVRDVSIFDGSQMGAATRFTKIWRLKNSGEVPWPPGTRMLFVGGDQMTETTEMSVPLSRGGPVMPGE